MALAFCRSVSLTRELELWGIAVCPGDVRLNAAPDAPLGALCSSAMHRPADREVVNAAHTWLSDTVTLRCLAHRSLGRCGIGDPSEQDVPTIWLCPDIAGRGFI